MKKIGFVVPWYGENNPGGAESLVRELTGHLFMSGIELEILTTCIKEFASDWGKNFYKEGSSKDSRGITVRRFKADKRDSASFDAVNLKLMKGISISSKEEEIFVRNSATSRDLIKYMDEHKEEYSFFMYAPYMFGTTIEGCRNFPEKSVVIPCFHDESYFYMEYFKETFSRVRGLIYNAYPEYVLSNDTYDLKNVNQKVLGTGVDVSIKGNGEAFRSKFNIDGDYIIYAGRKDAGKNVDKLVNYHTEYITRRKNEGLKYPKLVLIGGGSIDIPSCAGSDIIDLGFVDRQDMYDGMNGSLFLCQPSSHESFSLVIMESWLCGRPVLVSEDCAVTLDFAKRTNGGLYFKDYYDYEGCVDFFMNNEDINKVMAENGCKYVKENFSWDEITDRTIKFLESCL